MPSMKNTTCRLCGKNLTKYSYDYQTKHIMKCHPQQTLDELFKVG